MSASAARNIEYSGSVAYDLSRFDRRKRVRDALELEPVAIPRPIAKPHERVKAEAKAKARPAVSATTVIAFLMVAVLMFCVVLNYMRVYELSLEISNLQAEYNKLKSEAAVLKVQSEKKMNDIRIAELAAEMGMTRPARDQIIYVDMSQPDKGIVLAESEVKNDFLNGLKTLFLAAIDFFK